MPQLSSHLTALRASQNAEPLIHPALCFPQTRSNRPRRRQKEAGRPRPVLPSPERGAVSQLFSCEKGASPRRPPSPPLMPPARKTRRRHPGRRGRHFTRRRPMSQPGSAGARIFSTPHRCPAPSCPRKAIPSSWRPRTGRRVPGRIYVHARPAQIAEIAALPHCRASRLLSPAARSQFSGGERLRRPSPGVSGFSSFSVPGASLRRHSRKFPLSQR